MRRSGIGRLAKRPTLRALIALVALLGIGAVVGALVRWRASGRPLNAIIILVDTLRADHLSLYGYERATSPNLDRFFRQGVVFRAARSQAPCTFPSVNSLLTSHYPSQFLAQPEKRMGIPDDVPSIAEILHARGYATVAVSASPVVSKTGTQHNKFGGFGRGFDAFDENSAAFRPRVG
ncbi:MAG: sulfatase-like hydrolase/transferase [Deltaproteobacteria bacterium]|nr:sulfatase-like hydrolase/transferase [Deltaproteobacteria bacterium]MBI3387021.1 sulfatase-like hydrolase/transferase [Deltaproteobacteria bacterium]